MSPDHSEEHPVDIIGTYRIYDGDRLLLEQKNALTSVGRSIAIKSLLGYDSGLADIIVLGIGNSKNSLNSASTLITNNVLDFEVARVPILSTNSELSDDLTMLVFYGTIEDSDQYSIYEIGLSRSKTIDQTVSVDGSVLMNFDQVDMMTKYGTASYVSLQDSSSARIGTQMLLMNQGNGTTNYIEKKFDNNSLISIVQYSSDDIFKLAMYNTTTSVASVNFRFYTDSSNYYTLTIVSSSAIGYQIASATKGSAVKTGTPDWNDISSVTIWNSSSQDIYIDALKIDMGSYVIDTNYGLVSRAPLSTPITKTPSVPLTVQYTLLANFSGGG